MQANIVPYDDDFARLQQCWNRPRPRRYDDALQHCWRRWPCKSPKCSRQCRDAWSVYWSGIVQKSHKERPLTHVITLGLSALVLNDNGETAVVKNLLDRMNYRGIEYLTVNEWSPSGKRHQHILCVSPIDVTTPTIRPLIDAAINSQRPPHELDGGVKLSVDRLHDSNAMATIKYVFKDVICTDKKTLPPSAFRGRVIYGPTRSFLVRSTLSLWSEVKSDWYGNDAL